MIGCLDMQNTSWGRQDCRKHSGDWPQASRWRFAIGKQECNLQQAIQRKEPNHSEKSLERQFLNKQPENCGQLTFHTSLSKSHFLKGVDLIWLQFPNQNCCISIPTKKGRHPLNGIRYKLTLGSKCQYPQYFFRLLKQFWLFYHQS